MGDMESASTIALHSLLKDLGGDQEAGDPRHGVGEAREGRHAVHQLLNHRGEHVGAQVLVESLHGVGEVPS